MCILFDIAIIVMFIIIYLFFFKQKPAYEMRISDWSSDVCSSDLQGTGLPSRQSCRWPHRRSMGLGECRSTRRSIDRLRRSGGSADREDPGAAIGRASSRESVCQYV